MQVRHLPNRDRRCRSRAGQSVELIHDIVPVRTIVDRYESELNEAWQALSATIRP